MIGWIIEQSVKNRFLVIIVTAIITGIGIYAMLDTPVDAIPDLSDVQVIIYTEYPGQSAEVVEDQVTYPLSNAMLAVPFAKTVRGYSMFGYSLVYVIFEDGTDLYWARSRVIEYLNFASRRMPRGVTPQIGPDATGVGWVYIYTLTSKNHSLDELRSIQDWYLRYELESLQGVSEVASAGGYVKQYQIEVDPEKLRAYGIMIDQLNSAVEKANRDTGGGAIEMAESEFMIRSKGYLSTISDFEKIPIGMDDETHTPIFLSQVARVHRGPEMRRGVIEFNGTGEAVSGIVVMRFGENALKVIDRVKERLEELKAGLPEGVELHTSYDRSDLIHRSIGTLKSTLIEEMLVVLLVCVLFLLHIRSSLVAIFTLPVGILISFIVMRILGINANIMSLSGIAVAIGAMVDSSVVMVENLHKHKERGGNQSHLEMVIASAKEVGPSLFFALLILTISFLPVLTLQQQEGRLFKPLAYTKTFAMAAASMLAITIIPVLMYYFMRGKVIGEEKNPLSRFFIRIYKPIIQMVLRIPLTTILIAVLITSGSWYIYKELGTEFMPPLDEGDILYMPTTAPGISITKAKELLQQTDKLIAKHPQVETVLGKAGRAETATDPAPLSMLETHITLKPKSEWPKGKTIEDIVRELDSMVKFPGLTNSWTMPIKTRIDMLATGIKTPLGIKIMGDDLEQLSETGEKIEAKLKELKGVSSVYSERGIGGNYIDIKINREASARYGLNVDDIQMVVESALGGMNVTQTIEGLARYPVNVRYAHEFRDDYEKLKILSIPTPMGHAVPLSQVAELSIGKGPAEIKSENAKKNIWVFVDLSTSDISGAVKKVKQKIANEVKLPAGVSLVWSGQFEYIERVQNRLAVIIPFLLALIFLLLYIHYRDIIETMIVMVTLPFALVGGVLLMKLAGYQMSVAVAVGFIALAGLAAETGMVMLVYLDEVYARWKREGRLKTVSDLKQIVLEGAVDRVRPKLMTVTTTIVGLLPAMAGDETGASVMKRIAAPLVGGLISSAVLTLLIIPAIYFLWKRWVHRREF